VRLRDFPYLEGIFTHNLDYLRFAPSFIYFKHLLCRGGAMIEFLHFVYFLRNVLPTLWSSEGKYADLKGLSQGIGRNL